VTQIPDGVCRSEAALYLAVRRPPQSMVMTVDGDDVGRAASRFRTAGRGRRHYPERLIEAPPARFELAHPAPEAGALSPELWGLCNTEPGLQNLNAERLPVPVGGRDTACDTRADTRGTRRRPGASSAERRYAHRV
jgi:hypothetical protein